MKMRAGESSWLQLEEWKIYVFGGESGNTWHQIICECGHCIKQSQWKDESDVQCRSCDKEIPDYIIGFLWLCE